MKFRFAAPAFLFLGSLAFAEESPTIPPPRFPMSFRAPENSQWTVVRNRKNANPAEEGTEPERKKQPYVYTLVVEKTHPIYHETASVRNGRNWEKWVFFTTLGDFQLIKYAGDSGWTRLPRAVGVKDTSNYRKSDFEEFQWANEDTFKGATKIDELPVYSFETNTNNGPLTSSEAFQYNYGAAMEAKLAGETYGTNLTVTAYVDPKTLLPIKFDNGTEVFMYAFGAAPPSRLNPPSEVVAELKKWLAEIQVRKR